MNRSASHGDAKNATHAERQRHGRRDRDRTPDQAARANDLSPAGEDRHQANVRDVHPESRGRRRDEGRLGGQRDDAEGLVARARS